MLVINNAITNYFSVNSSLLVSIMSALDLGYIVIKNIEHFYYVV